MSFFEFLIRSTVCFSVLYLLYRFFFTHNTFFQARRIYLLLLPLVSTAYPFLCYPAETVAMVKLTLPELVVPVFARQETAAPGFDLFMILLSIYAAGVLFSLLLLGYRFLKTRRMIQSAKPLNGVISELPPELPATAFSFGNTIYIHPQIPEEELPLIVAHEQVHIRQRHTTDRIYFEVLAVFFWFNPLYRLALKSLAETHEFIADQQACGDNAVQYKRVLVAHILGLPARTLVHLYAEPGSLKKRLLMMNKKRTSRLVLWGYLAVIPILGGLVTLNSFTFTRTAVERNKGDNEIDKQPEFKGGNAALAEYLGKNIAYPADAKAQKTAGMVVIAFTVEANGKISNPVIKKSVSPALDAEALRVISNMPDWNPGENKGKLVKAEMTLPIRFKLD